jgi:hypothetical protein
MTAQFEICKFFGEEKKNSNNTGELREVKQR